MTVAENDDLPMQSRRGSLFVATVRIGADNAILEERLGQ
jgi:hypothetical protein